MDEPTLTHFLGVCDRLERLNIETPGSKLFGILVADGNLIANRLISDE